MSNPEPATRVDQTDPVRRLYSKNYLADEIGCHLRTIDRYIERGWLQCLKIGHLVRITPEQRQAFYERMAAERETASQNDQETAA